MFLVPGAPTIVTAADTAVFVIKQKRAVPKKHCPLPTGGFAEPHPKKAPQGLFCPPGRKAAGTVRVAVPASGCAPWAGLALCDRGPCFGSLLPPQAAVAFAAVQIPSLPPVKSHTK